MNQIQTAAITQGGFGLGDKPHQILPRDEMDKEDDDDDQDEASDEEDEQRKQDRSKIEWLKDEFLESFTTSEKRRVTQLMVKDEVVFFQKMGAYR